jgi:hypothetical protein
MKSLKVKKIVLLIAGVVGPLDGVRRRARKEGKRRGES